MHIIYCTCIIVVYIIIVTMSCVLPSFKMPLSFLCYFWDCSRKFHDNNWQLCSSTAFSYTIGGRLFINFCTVRSVGVEGKLKEEPFSERREKSGGRKRKGWRDIYIEKGVGGISKINTAFQCVVQFTCWIIVS